MAVVKSYQSISLKWSLYRDRGHSDAVVTHPPPASVVGGKTPGPVFTKGLRLSQVLGLNPVLKLRLLSHLSFVLKPYSQRVT